MLDQLVNLVKEQLGSNPEIAAQIPADKSDAIHQEIANQLGQGLAGQASSQGGIGGLLASLQNGLGSGSPVTSGIEGGLVSSLGSKFGLSPAVTGAIAAALPGLLQKFATKANDPNDNSITPDSIGSTLSKLGGAGGLGGLFK